MKLIEKVRTICDEADGCWLWRANKHSCRAYPQICIGRSKVSARRVAYEHFVGRIPDGCVIVSACEHKNCLRHLKAITRAELNRRTGKSGLLACPARHAKIAAKQRENRSPLTPEQVQDIRYGPGSLREAARRHGCSKSCAASIRQGRTWKDYSNPFAGLGA